MNADISFSEARLLIGCLVRTSLHFVCAKFVFFVARKLIFLAQNYPFLGAEFPHSERGILGAVSGYFFSIGEKSFLPEILYKRIDVCGLVLLGCGGSLKSDVIGKRRCSVHVDFILKATVTACDLHCNMEIVDIENSYFMYVRQCKQIIIRWISPAGYLLTG